jgi:hypothetical protein
VIVVLQEIEREDQAWEDSQRGRKPTKQSKNLSSESDTPTPNWQPTKVIDQKTELEKARSNAPRGFF